MLSPGPHPSLVLHSLHVASVLSPASEPVAPTGASAALSPSPGAGVVDLWFGLGFFY